MNLGEFIIKIGTQGDTKGIEQMARAVENAEKKTRRLINYLRELREATSDAEKKIIKKNFAHQIEADKLRSIIQEQNAYSTAVQKSMITALKFFGAIKLGIIVLDRLGNSLLKSNQQYITFEKQSGISIGRLNKMAGLAQLSGMNLSPEQVMGDLQSLQQKFYEFGLGKGTGIFAQMGINPLGMKADDFMPVLRQRLKGESAATKSYILSSLGLSQEWLNVIDLSDEKFKEYLKTSKELQLTEKERKQLAEYTAQQQKNNMKWELAKQKLLISIMPMVQKIMDVTSNAAISFSKFLNAHPKWIDVLRDVLILMTGGKLLKTLSAFSALGKLFSAGAIASLFGGVAKAGAGGLLAKTGGKFLAKRGAAMAGGLAGGSVGAIFSIAMGIWTFIDLFKMFTNKQDEDANADISPDPDEGGQRYNYNNVNTAMTNNFFNNPQPVSETINQLNAAVNRYTQYQYR